MPAGETVTDPATGQQRQVVSDREAGGYMVGLRAAGQDCRSRFDWLRAWFAALPD